VTIVNVALDAIGRRSTRRWPSLQWVVDAYTLLLAALLLSAGALGDRFGPRKGLPGRAGAVRRGVGRLRPGRWSRRPDPARVVQGAAGAPCWCRRPWP
jgi:DHA2 family methylenomycin A resistance protein-like MFS transporter